jgi:taurine dioxygenase/alpha-ketoglutarate-dependent 2,4-dichlorophenoxyacetate dioxygenase
MAMTEMAARVGITLRRLSPALGAEVEGLDLSRPMPAGAFEALRAALQEHHVVCVRGQSLTEAQQIAFSELFGPLETFPEKDKTKSQSTIYNVANVSPEGQHLPVDDHRVIAQKVNARWHTDSSYRFIPSYCSLLYGIEVLPPEAEGGQTEFANLFLAHDALPPEMRRRLEPLFMVHYYEFGRRIFPQLPPVSQVERDFVPPTCHPLIRVHPDRDGRRSLFFTVNAGNEVSGMELEEGQRLLRELAAHVERPEFCYRHQWRAGDLVIWDNRCLLHRAIEYDAARHRRVMRRTTVAGPGPVLGPFSRP